VVIGAAHVAGHAGGGLRATTPARLFLVASLLAGLGYLALFPPLAVADEPVHLFRAYTVATGRLLPEKVGQRVGAPVPVSLQRVEPELGVGPALLLEPDRKLDADALRAALHWPLDPGRTAFADFPNAAQYPAVVHLPQAVGIGIGRLLGLGPLWLVYLGRLSNLVTATLLTWCAIRITPLGGWCFCWLALSPMAVSSRGSLSPDALTNAAALLFLAEVARLIWSEAPPTARDPLRIGGAAVLLCLTKLPYCLLLLALLAVPRQRLELGRRLGAWLGAAAATLAALGFTVWTARTYGRVLVAWFGIDQDRQIHGILVHPLHFLVVVGRHYWRFAARYTSQAAGRQLGWLDVQVPAVWAAVYLLVMVAVLLLAGSPRVVVHLRQRLLFVGIVVAVLVVVAASQYVVWTPVGADDVRGLQGRYFLPVAPLLVLALHRRPASELPPRAVAATLAFACLLLTAASWAAMLRRYY